MKINHLLQLTRKRFIIAILAEIIAIILHNAIYAMFGIEDAFFFILAIFIIPLYLFISLPYTFFSLVVSLSKSTKHRRKSIAAGIFIITAYSMLVSEFSDSVLTILLADIVSGLSVVAIAIIFFSYFNKTNSLLSKKYLLLKSVEGALMILAGLALLFPQLIYLRGFIYEQVHVYVFIISAYLFYYLLAKSKLVPAFFSYWGYLAVSALLLTTLLKLAHLAYPPQLEALLLLIIANELFLALWLLLNGFKKTKK